MSIPLNRIRFLVLSTLLIATVTIAEEASSNKPSKRQDSVEAELERLLAQLTLEEKVSLCHANSKFAIAGVERLGIQEMWMSDGPHGV
jgi:beta-glucosidase